MDVHLTVTYDEANELLILTERQAARTKSGVLRLLLPRFIRQVERKWERLYKNLALKIENQLPDLD